MTTYLLNQSEPLEINLMFGIDYPCDGEVYSDERKQDFDLDESHEYRDECEKEG